MTADERALALIRRYEGLRLAAYADAVGTWTIGYGHTKGAHAGQRCTVDEANEWLREDYAESGGIVDRAVSVPLTPSMRGALTSMAFNLGSSPFMSSTTLMRRLLNREYLLVPTEMCRWIYAGGRLLLGLARRRVDEAALFLADGLPEK